MESATFLWYLAGVTARSLGLAAIAAIAMLLFRVKAAAARHAVWTVVVAGMLALAAFEPMLPPLPVRVLHASPAPAAQLLPPPPGLPSTNTPRPAPAAPVAQPRAAWPPVVYAAGFLLSLGRLAFGYLFTRRLVRASQPIDRPSATPLYESSWISVPATAGWLRPKILLPAGWDRWPEDKLQAVLAHERTHVERADWAIAVLAGFNRCVFWFHPLAWWLERRLAMLAEQACDDAALRLVATESYAQALLDMAAAVKTGHGRLVWEAMAMANGAQVRKRIERILDETRQIPEGLTRRRWAALIACGLPLIYIGTVLQPVPAQAPPPQQHFAAAAEVSMEQRLAANPHDLSVRAQLIEHYLAGGMREPRLAHTYWLIANHPETGEAAHSSQWISARSTAFNDAADFDRAAMLWKQQAAARSQDVRVLRNAAEFFAQPGGDFSEAERLLTAARSIEPQNLQWRHRLASLYITAVTGNSGDSAFAGRVKRQLETSSDGELLGQTGRMLSLIARAEQLGSPAPPPATAWQADTSTPTLNPAPPPIDKVDPVYPALARQARIEGTVRLIVTIFPDGHVYRIQTIGAHPLLAPAAIDAVKQWVYSPVPDGGKFEVDVPFTLPPRGVTGGVSGGVPGGVPGGVSGGVPGGVSGGVPGGVNVTEVDERIQTAKLITRVEPSDPPLARQARVSGTVLLEVTVGEDGRVRGVRSRSGHPLLVPAAIEAVKLWVYSPTLVNGVPSAVMTAVTLTF